MNWLRLLVPLLLAAAAWSQGTIRLKTRTFTPAPLATGTRQGPPVPVRRDYLVLFRSAPGPDVLAELARRRIQVVAAVPDDALMVSAMALNLSGLDVIWWGPMEPTDKISPSLATQETGAYLLMFHADTSSVEDSALVVALGFTAMDGAPLLPHQLVVMGAPSALPTLAALDEVAYILPASAELQDGGAVAGCAGALTTAGTAAQYVLATSGWSKDAAGKVALQYFVDTLTPKLDEATIRVEIARAFAEWARYANISIAPATAANLARSIDIEFARFAHGDAYPFDGPGGALAHTFYPAPSNAEPIAGDMHLDADESWHAGAAVDLFSVALHETGHALGLGHSDNPGAVMYPYYRQLPGLTSDDIAGVQALYGPPGVVTPAPPAGGNGGATTVTPPPSSGTGSSPKPPTDTVAPVLSVISPSSTIVSTSSATIAVSGAATDNIGVTRVTWTTTTGSAGIATGTNAWSASIPLLVGDNTVIMRAYDAAGNSSWRAFTVVRH